MDELLLAQNIEATRLLVMKLKYYTFVQAFKRAYTDNPSQADIELFLEAAKNLGQDDVCDILFPYSVVEESKTRQYNKNNKKEDNYLDMDIYDEAFVDYTEAQEVEYYGCTY